MDRNEPVELVEHQFEHGQFRVEEICHRVAFDCFTHNCEGQILMLIHGQIQESGYKIHTLTVVQLRIRNCICFQYIFQSFSCYIWQTVEWSDNIDINGVSDLFRELSLLLCKIEFKLTCDEVLIHFQDLKPQFLSLFLYFVDICSHEGLLENLFTKYFIQIFA